MKNKSSPLTAISNPTQMQSALASPNAVVFAHVEWAIQSVAARKTVTDFALQLQRDGDSAPIDFYVLDLTNAQQNAPNYVNAWLASDSRLSDLPIRGSGDVVWLKNGVVQKSRPACDMTVDDLNAETKNVFNNE